MKERSHGSKEGEEKVKIGHLIAAERAAPAFYAKTSGSENIQ